MLVSRRTKRCLVECCNTQHTMPTQYSRLILWYKSQPFSKRESSRPNMIQPDNPDSRTWFIRPYKALKMLIRLYCTYRGLYYTALKSLSIFINTLYNNKQLESLLKSKTQIMTWRARRFAEEAITTGVPQGSMQTFNQTKYVCMQITLLAFLW